MRLDKYARIDAAYDQNIYPDLWIHYHNFLVKYKNYDRIHTEAVKLYDRHLSIIDDISTDNYSRLGMFMRACITAGYAKAKTEMGETDDIKDKSTLPIMKFE